MRKAQSTAEPQLRGLDASGVQAVLDQYQLLADHSQSRQDNAGSYCFGKAIEILTSAATAAPAAQPAAKLAKARPALDSDLMERLEKIFEGR